MIAMGMPSPVHGVDLGGQEVRHQEPFFFFFFLGKTRNMTNCLLEFYFF